MGTTKGRGAMERLCAGDGGHAYEWPAAQFCLCPMPGSHGGKGLQVVGSACGKTDNSLIDDCVE